MAAMPKEDENLKDEDSKILRDVIINKRTDKDFIFGKLIGEGSFSSVYLVKDQNTDKEYAIKSCDKYHIKRENKINSVLREKDLMDVLNRNWDKTAPFFVKLYFAFQSESTLYFVMTYCRNGELLKWIKNVGNFDRASASFYSAEIVKALEHLRRLKIVHRDLKPENIILDDNLHIRITDFGSAKRLTEEEIAKSGRRSSFVGTAQYVSPEVLKSKEVTYAADLWALGCIIYQMVSGLPPFNDPSEYLITQQILKLEYEFPNGFDEDAKDIVKQFLVLEDSLRLGALDANPYSSIRTHPFFEGIDFETLYLQVPPEICVYMPELEDNKVYWKDEMEPGLIPGLRRSEFPEFAVSRPRKSEEKITSQSLASNLRLSLEEHKRRLAEQQEKNIYHQYVDGTLILKQGELDKRKGLFPRRRMFLLTTGPRLFYVDSENKILKGEVPFSASLRPDPKNFKTFYVHTPNRTYYLEDPNETSHEWCDALKTVRNFYFAECSGVD